MADQEDQQFVRISDNETIEALPNTCYIAPWHKSIISSIPDLDNVIIFYTRIGNNRPDN